MSAALQMPMVWAAADFQKGSRGLNNQVAAKSVVRDQDDSVPEISLRFYRKHTEKVLQRYLYASMLVGRAPAVLGEPVARGWASSRPVKTFEDAVIFVLDVERCLDRLGVFDRQVLSRIALQQYTHAEAADLLGFSVRAISYKYPLALDHLTRLLLKAGLLILPTD